jgi:hypothetical protein
VPLASLLISVSAFLLSLTRCRTRLGSVKMGLEGVSMHSLRHAHAGSFVKYFRKPAPARI